MRVAELVEETAKELQERGGAEQGDTVNMWCVSAMEKAAAGCSPLGIPRAGSAPEGYRFPDKEFEVLMAMWMGLPVGVRRPCPTAQCRQQADIWGVHGGMTCGGASEGHAVRSAMARRHNELAKQLWAALRTGGIPAMLEQQGWDGSKKRPGDVTCDSEPLGLPGRRTIFDTTVVAMQAPTRLATVVKALGTQITGRPWAWVDGKGDVRQAVDAAAAGARERKLRLYTDMTVEKVGDGPDIVRPAGVLMPDEKLFVVAVSADARSIGAESGGTHRRNSGVLVPAGGSVVSRDGEDLDLSVVEMVAVEVVCWGGGHAYAGSGSGGVREPLGQRLTRPRIRIRLGCR
jgi:hypothetical protein